MTAGDSRDNSHIERFLPYRLEYMLFGHLQYPDYWYLEEMAFYPVKKVTSVLKLPKTVLENNASHRNKEPK